MLATASPLIDELRPTRIASARILLVENAALIRLDMKEMLAESGGTVVGESDSAAAAITMTIALKPDLVIFDSALVSDDPEFADRLRALDPAPAVVETRFSQPRGTVGSPAEPEYFYVMKPFSPTQLLVTAVRALDFAGRTPNLVSL